ncbi:hypothetical protein P8452_17529 [Trifolium repens]|nr:hypothetical protein P8452_17529 [Trifolium repens]
MTTLQKFKVWGNKPIVAACCISDSEQAQAGQYSDNVMDLLNRELNSIHLVYHQPGRAVSHGAFPLFPSIFVS